MLFFGTFALCALWGIGQLAADRTWITGLCFYVPSPLMGFLLIVLAVVELCARSCRRAMLAICLAILPLFSTFAIENHPFRPMPGFPANRIRLVHWNVGGRLGKAVQQVLCSQTADVYVLSEVPSGAALSELQSQLPGYSTQWLATMAIVSAGPIRSQGPLLNENRANVHFVTCELADGPLTLLVVDLPSDPRIARDPLLRNINRLIEQHRPDIVVGDFNAPRRSRALRDLPDGYQHAYNAVGTGWGYTWPEPIPLYSLDQCILSARVTPGRYELESSWLSDHRLQRFDFDFRAE